MAQSKTRSRRTDGSSHFVRGSSHLEEALMLLRLQTALLRCSLPELEKQTKLVAKFAAEAGIVSSLVTA